MRSQIHRTPIAIVGPGRLGSALAQALFHRGATIRVVVGPHKPKAENLALRVACDLAVESVAEIPAEVGAVFICTPDDAIEEVALQLAQTRLPFRRLFVAHFSGLQTSDALSSVQEKEARVASIHPVQSFAGDDQDWQRLAGIYYGIEAEGVAWKMAEELVRFLGGSPVLISKTAKPAYHLACSLASNLTVALVESAAEVLAGAGLHRKEAVRILLPLVEGTVRNIRQLGTTGAITGPLARGDAGTVAAHLKTLLQQHPELAPVYRALGKVAVSLGRKRGSFDESKGAEIDRLLD